MRRLILLVAFCSLAFAQEPKKRIAVMNFDYGTVSTYTNQLFGSNVDVGKGIADMLVDRFVNDGVFSVIERKALDKLMTEQNFSNSDRADPASAAKIGKLLGVSAIVIGSITQFGRDDSNKNFAGGGSTLGRFGVGGIGKKEAKAVVQITARLVDVNTGEILASAPGNGESKRGGTSLLGAGGGGGSAGGAGMSMGSSNFGATILGEATNQAVSECATKIETNAAKLPTPSLDGMVADVTGKQLILNIGRLAGLKVGDKLIVFRTGKEIKDPASGRVLRRSDAQIGEVTITETDDASSVGTYSGASEVKVGDHVKK